MVCLLKSPKILFFAVALLAACTSTVESDPVAGKHTIVCGDEMSDCYEKATSLCPDGYLVTNRVRPTQVDDAIQYTMNIKCRAGFKYY